MFYLSRKIGGKQFLFIVVAWLVISYLLIWFFGGACTDIFHGGTCLSQDSLSFLRDVPVIGWFLPFGPFNSVMYFFAPIAGFVLAFFLINWFNEYFETKQGSSIWFLPLIIVVLLFGFYINLSWYYNEAAVMNSNSQVKVGLSPFLCFIDDLTQPVNGRCVNFYNISNNFCGSADWKVCSKFVDSAKQACFYEPNQTEFENCMQRVATQYSSEASATQVSYIWQYIPIDYWDRLRNTIFFPFILGVLAAWLPLFFKGLYESREEDEEEEPKHHEHKHEEHEHHSSEHKPEHHDAHIEHKE